MSRLLDERDGRGGAVMKNMADMFGLSGECKITTLPLYRLRENANHPFKVFDDERLSALAESIRTDGLVQPIIVRPVDGGMYEILSGHRRTRATGQLGERTIKAIVVEADDERANQILIDTNFRQRDRLLPSEIARSYKLRYDDLKKFRKNSDGRNSDNVKKIDEELAEEFHCSKSSIYMYLHFNQLIDKLLDLLDERKLKQKIAEEISYLRDSEQSLVYELVFEQRLCTLDLKKAARLRQEHESRELGRSDIMEILAPEIKPVKKHAFFSKDELEPYQSKFSSPEEMERAIIRFLENYESG